MEYLLIASAILAAIVGLTSLIDQKVGRSGEAGSMMDVVRDQLVNPEANADALLGL